MNEKIFFIILIVFLMTNEFYFTIKNIIKYGIYIILILYILKIISPELSTTVKSKIIDSLDDKNSNIITKILSYIGSFIASLIKKILL